MRPWRPPQQSAPGPHIRKDGTLMTEQDSLDGRTPPGPGYQKRKLVGLLTHLPAGCSPPAGKCGAHTKKGRPCIKNALPGKTRCRLHGGLSTGNPVGGQPGNQNGAKARLYAQLFFPEELEWLDAINKDHGGMSLASELEVARVQYLRAAVAQKKWLAYRHQLDHATNEMLDAEMRRLGVFDQYEIQHKSGVNVIVGTRKADSGKAVKDGGQVMPTWAEVPYEDLKVVKRQRDYAREIRKFGNLVDRLMRTEHEMRQADMGEDNVAKIAEDLQLFYENAAAMMPGGGPDGSE